MILSCLVFFKYQHNEHQIAYNEIDNSESFRKLNILIGLTFFGLLLPGVFQTFKNNPLPVQNSDVILQMQVQFERFMRGEQPYAPVKEFSWNPFPVYMPMHWLPIGIGKYFDIDIRWGGFYILFIVYLYFLLDFKFKSLYKFESIIMALLPIIFIWFSYKYRPEDLNSVFDIVVYAYYFILGYGLVKMNHKMLIIGLIGVMLSRYTAVFWLPIFLFIIYHKYGKKVLIKYLISGAIAFSILFFFPFFIRDTSIVTKGLHYHNYCGIIDWQKISVNKEIPYTVTLGFSYIQFWAKIITGYSPAESITILRIVQLLTMILVNVISFFYYKRNKQKILASVNSYLLGFLLLQMLLFYATSALVFSHYWFTITPIIWALILSISENLNNESNY
jgi:hypothetical protein